MILSNKNLTKLPDNLPNKIRYFDCYGNKLTTLDNCPKIIEGYFDCSNNLLTTLKGCPEKVGESFYCYNNQLTTLEYGPKEVGESFYCNNNPNLSLKEILRFMSKCKIGGIIITDYGDLTGYKNRVLSDREILKIVLRLK
jgi:hypothetical protein